MLDFCLNTFEKEYSKKGDALILDRYSLAHGLYILVDKDTGEMIESINITKENCRDSEYLDMFAKMDYLSKIINTNKSVSNKKIHSNNYLSFFVKAENIIPNKNGVIEIGDDEISKYYLNLSNGKDRTKDNNAKKMYELVSKEIGDIDLISLNKCMEWIKENIATFEEKYSLNEKSNYVKVFFKEDIDIYEKENRRYTIPRIFNKNENNKFFGDNVYGVPDNNFGMNDKKPYMMLKGKLTAEPMLVGLEKVELMKKFFEYLLCLVESQPKFSNLYISEESLKPISSEDVLSEDFSGVFLNIKKTKSEAEIVDFDIIERFRPSTKINVSEVISTINLEEDKSLIKYGKLTDIKEVKNQIDSIFFNGYLSKNMFSSSQDILSLKIPKDIKRNIIELKDALANWFYKGDLTKLKLVFHQKSMKIIIDNVLKGYTNKAAKQINLRYAIINYLEGVEVNMKRRFEDLHEKIIDGLLDKNLVLENDEEYCFFVGQVVYYLLNKSKSGNKNMDMIRIIESSNYDVMIKKFNMLYKKYRHSEFLNDSIMRYAISTVMDYKTNYDKVNLEALNCGYLYNNSIMMAKKERNIANKAKNGGNDNE